MLRCGIYRNYSIVDKLPALILLGIAVIIRFTSKRKKFIRDLSADPKSRPADAGQGDT